MDIFNDKLVQYDSILQKAHIKINISLTIVINFANLISIENELYLEQSLWHNRSRFIQST